MGLFAAPRYTLLLRTPSGGYRDEALTSSQDQAGARRLAESALRLYKGAVVSVEIHVHTGETASLYGKKPIETVTVAEH